MARQLLIGVATTVVPCDKKGKTVSRFFSGLARLASERGGELILFHPARIDFARGRVVGYMLAGGDTERWVYREERLPTAIYENVYVHLVVQGLTKGLRLQAKAKGIPFFNPVIYGKWTMHRFVERHPECGMLLPETRRVEHERVVRTMLDRYGTVYVKPIGGYGGRGVLRVQRQGERYQVDADSFGGARGSLHSRFTEAELRTFITRTARRSPHIVQQQIPLLQLSRERKADFRVVVQRDGQGEWQLVGIVPKVTAAGGVVTNLVAGGSRGTWDGIIESLGQRAKGLSKKPLESAALALANKLSAVYPTLGIVGYDLGLDEQGRVWLIEVNPKPARSLLDGEMRKRSARLAVDYTLFLARRSRFANADM